MKKIELLAPAGNMDSLIAAVQAGCDAVYLGMNVFSARAFAGNFSNEALIEAVKYCHLRNVNVYVAVNTMLYEDEIENAIPLIDFLYHHDVDAVIIQDLGLFDYVRQHYPDFEIHISTQMHIHNLNGVEFMKQAGASRIVLARETPIEIIQKACQKGIEIEVFAYGALCISYSGQCLISSSLKNRSGNKGMCAQYCRMKYKGLQDEKTYSSDGQYLLSPKDLNLLEHVPELIEAGVTSLKIEGRMKRSEYVFLVISLFRKAIDAYYEKKHFQLTPTEIKELKVMFHRGFTKGHVFHDTFAEHMNHYRPNHQGIKIGTVVGYAKNKVQVKLSDTLNQHDGLRFICEPEDIGIVANRIELNGKLVNAAKKGDIVEIPYDEYIKPGTPLHKTTDIKLNEQIQRAITQSHRQVEIDIQFQAIVDQPLILDVTDGLHNVHVESTVLVQTAKSSPIDQARMVEALSKCGDSVYFVRNVYGVCDNIFMPIRCINETRRIALEKLDALRLKKYPNRMGKRNIVLKCKKPTVSFPRNLVDLQFAEQRIDADAYFVSENKVSDTHMKRPVIYENDNQVDLLNECLLSQIGDLNHSLKNCIAGMTFNIANSYAMAFILNQPGIEGLVVSSELPDLQLQKMLLRFKQRYGFEAMTYQLVYGRRKLMYIKHDISTTPYTSLVDMQSMVFDIKKKDGVTELLEPMNVYRKNLGCYGNLFILTNENESEFKTIMEEFENL